MAGVLEDLIGTLDRWFGRVTSDAAPDIDLTTIDYKPGRPFRLYVGVSGVIVGVDKGGNTINRTFIAGYHPISFMQITKIGTTATDLGACF